LAVKDRPKRTSMYDAMADGVSQSLHSDYTNTGCYCITCPQVLKLIMRILRHATALLLTSLTVTDAFTNPRPAAYTSSTHKLRLNAVEKEFENDGPFSLMQPFLPLFGFSEGRTTYFGPGIEVKESDYPSEEEQQARREKAKEEMMNIGQEERDRRRLGGEIAYKAAISYAIVSSLILDDGSFSGHLARFAVVLPLFFASGYTKSAESGL